MAGDLKPQVDPESTLERLDIRLGRVLSAEAAQGAPREAYRITADFGKYGQRVTVGRFTGHAPKELIGLPVLGVLNFAPREIGGHTSEFLLLGVQMKGKDSGEATPLTVLGDVKLGSKVF
ncbi:hypothetical protein GCM10017783_10970 [Deinococcus piscis]|uniref:tRNA-binding domain-containing protein n=1 Tax=Deinococcus piscis TaxID=394230 RepID=A0ABQ3K216_9DEIO|nr:tRNA-binding protein [Deinococcus piscis]GHG00627.1 hypothetical protein GCM10017783_10970 [Deinococcus piscis]